MIKNLDASEKLYLLIFVMSVFIIGIGVYGINEMKTMNQNSQTLYADRVIPMEQLTTVRYAYWNGIISSTQQAQTHRLSFIETVSQISNAQKSIHVNWDAYMLTYLTPEESVLAKQAIVLMDQSNIIIEKLKVILKKADTHALDKLINNEFYTGINPLIAKLNELINLQVSVAGELHSSSDKVYNNALKQFILLIIVSLAFAIPFAYYLVRSVRYLIKNLRLSHAKITESEEKYRSLVEHAGDAIFVVNTDLTFSDINTSACKLLGYSHDELLDKKIAKVFDPEDLQKRPLQIEILRKNKVLLSERTLRRKDGSEVTVELNIKELGEKGYLVIARDITERKRAENLLRESEDRFSKAFRSAPVAIAATEISNGEFFEVNGAMERFLGYERRELLGQTTFGLDMWVNLEDRQYVVDELKNKGSVYGLNFKFHTKDGKIVLANYAAELIDLDGKKCILSVLEDITERKQIEKALQESEKKYRNIFENVQDVFYQTSPAGLILEVSPSIKYHTGFAREQMIGSQVINLYHNQADREKILNLLTEKRELTDYELRFKSSTGEAVDVSLNAKLIQGDDETPSHIDGLFRNITERKKAEEKIIQSEARLKEAQAIAHIGNWEVDMGNNIHMWSDECYKIFGANKEEVQPSIETFLSFIHPDDLDRAQEDIREAFVSLSDSTSDYRFMRKGGSMAYVHSEWRFEFNKNRQPIRLYGILQDITERKKAEESIKQSEANYRQLFKLSPAPMWVLEEGTFKFMQVNQACINNYGYSEEEFANMTIGNIIPQDDESPVKNASLKNHTPVFFMDVSRHIKKSGEIMQVETSSIPVTLNGKKQILVIAIDVTEKNLYEQKLTRAAIKAQEDERYEIGGELHDNVCQILATSLIFLGLVKRSLPEESNQFFDQTYQYITSASEEIRNLSHRLAPAFFDESTLEDAFKELLKNFNIESNYEIKLDFDRHSKSQELSRELQLNLYRILQEQMRNILKYAKATSIGIAVTSNNNILQMSIVDNGVGFDVESMKGGIGLANMNRRAQLFSGNFSVESAPGKGCEVIVKIPVQGNT